MASLTSLSDDAPRFRSMGSTGSVGEATRLDRRRRRRRVRVLVALAHARCARAGGLLLHDHDDAAVEPAALASQRRVAASAPRQLARRRGRALLLQLEGAGQGRPAAHEPAGRRARRRADGEGERADTGRRRAPPRIEPVFAHPLPGEGVWSGHRAVWCGGRPPVLVTTFRTEVDYPRIVAYVAWFDHTRTSIAFYPGRYEPPNAPVRGPMSVPYGQRWRLLATFNGGFIYRDGSNGSSINGRSYEPLKAGLATLIAYRDGRVDVTTWNGGPVAGPAGRVRTPEPAADHRPRTPQPGPERQLAVGLHARERRPRVADRRGHRPARQPDLCRGRLSDGDHARKDPATGGRGAGDAARHQPGVADADHVHPPRRPASGQESCPTTNSRRRGTSCRTTATSSPCTGACPAPSRCRSSDGLR